MKRSLFLLGMAAAALSSCTNEDVVDVAQNRAIRFDTFVNNNTRAVTEVGSGIGQTQLTSYYLFGKYGDATGNYSVLVFDNEPSSAIAYWTANKYYAFGAYANGNGKRIDNATFDANAGKLTFPSYSPNDEKDLVAATARAEAGADVTNKEAVSLQFAHMLSQVKFTFKTEVADSYTIKISDLKFNAVKTADGSYTKAAELTGTIDWTGNTSAGDYTYKDMSDIADKNMGYTDSDVKLVIPQNNTNQISVTFTATLSGPGIDSEVNKEFTANLGYEIGSVTDTKANTWTPGYRYNYTATINADDIKDDLKEIKFTTEVTGWEDANETPVTPSEKQ